MDECDSVSGAGKPDLCRIMQKDWQKMQV